MITLGSNSNTVLGTVLKRPPFVARVTRNPNIPEAQRRKLVLHWENPVGPLPSGFKLVLVSNEQVPPNPDWVNVIRIDPALAYLDTDDIIVFEPTSLRIRVMFRKRANINSFLLTERCNSFCLMCSQPPRDIDDGYRVDEILEALRLIPTDTGEIMFSGGEPTLLGDRFLQLVEQAEVHLPRTALHVLTNGRRFNSLDLTTRLAKIKHHDLMLGIPLYSDIASEHDFIVQADGAYDETIRGILNLKRARLRVELRVVIHKQNYRRLPALAEFIGRNLLFADQVALMGLEVTGFTKANLGALWIDPWDYRRQLLEAVKVLHRYRIRTLVFNHQLCTLHPEVRKFSVQSISDWKKEYLPACAPCALRSECGGFFSTSESKHSDHIAPIVDRAVA